MNDVSTTKAPQSPQSNQAQMLRGIIVLAGIVICIFSVFAGSMLLASNISANTPTKTPTPVIDVAYMKNVLLNNDFVYMGEDDDGEFSYMDHCFTFATVSPNSSLMYSVPYEDTQYQAADCTLEKKSNTMVSVLKSLYPDSVLVWIGRHLGKESLKDRALIDGFFVISAGFDEDQRYTVMIIKDEE